MLRIAPILAFLLAVLIPPPAITNGQSVPKPYRWLGHDPVGNDAVVNPRALGIGLGTVRIRFNWDAIQPTRASTYDWSYVDYLMGLAKTNDQRVIALITDNPVWAADSGQGPVRPDARDAFAAFLTAAATRFGGATGQIDYWEIYNEPDARGHEFVSERWVAAFGESAAEYADTLRRSRDAIRKADPKAKIALGGLALDWFTDQGGIFPRDFFPQLVKDGGLAYVDAVAIHVYPNFADNWAAYGPDIVGKVRYVREVMGKAGFDRPILITEYGYQVSSKEEGLDNQAAYVERSVVRLKALGVVTALWFAPIDGPDFYYGLWRHNSAPRPAATKFADTAFRLGDLSYAGAPPPGKVLSGGIEAYRAIGADGAFRYVMFAPAMTATLQLAADVPRSAYSVDPALSINANQSITVGVRPVFLSYVPQKGGLVFVPNVQKR